jgi:hypothetical protein
MTAKEMYQQLCQDLTVRGLFISSADFVDVYMINSSLNLVGSRWKLRRLKFPAEVVDGRLWFCEKGYEEDMAAQMEQETSPSPTEL